ncbi:hypothetical protein FACS189481_5790 [Clostridia bacterium]|nr:hypothetical protein FACS189481_5790 [Clostridia bacterium]
MPHLVNVLKSLNATCNITVRASQHNAKALANVGTELGSLQALAEGVCEDIMGVPDAQELKRIVFDYVMNKTAGAFALNFETDTRGRTVSFLPERNITLLLYYLYAYVHAPLL